LIQQYRAIFDFSVYLDRPALVALLFGGRMVADARDRRAQLDCVHTSLRWSAYPSIDLFFDKHHAAWRNLNRLHEPPRSIISLDRSPTRPSSRRVPLKPFKADQIHHSLLAVSNDA